MAIYLRSGRVEQNNHSSLTNWPDRELSSQHLRRLLGVFVWSSVYPCLSSTVPLRPLVGLCLRPTLFVLSLCLPYLSPFCQRHNSRRHSLFMRVLSHCDTHYLNMHMVGCGYHEILIQRSVTALFLTNFSLYPIRLWFWWLSYSNHSFQLLSNQYSVHHSDSARDHQSCNQKQFIATSYWRQAHIQSHLSCCNWNKAREFIAIDSAQNSHSLAKSKALAVSEISESYLFNNS